MLGLRKQATNKSQTLEPLRKQHLLCQPGVTLMTAQPLDLLVWQCPGFLPLGGLGTFSSLIVLGVVIAFAWELAAHTPRLGGKGSYQLIMFNFLGLREPFGGENYAFLF